MKKLLLMAMCCCLMMACGKSGQNADNKGNADESWQVDMGGGTGVESGNEGTDKQNAVEEKKQPPTVVLDAYQKQQLNDLTNRFCDLRNQLGKKQAAPYQKAVKFEEEDLKEQMSDIASEIRTRVGKLQDQMRAASVTSGDQWETLIEYYRLVEGY
ncbi:MAG: hypothetical protein IKX36_07555 [Prevotella sp.]|nr:hypothetical protein [Prevotella sp.]